MDDFMAFIKPAEQVIVDMELHEAPFPVPHLVSQRNISDSLEKIKLPGTARFR